MGRLRWSGGAVLENIGRVPEEQQGKYLSDHLARMAAFDPASALAKLSEYDGHPGRGEIAGGVARALLATDPAAARAIIEGLEGDALGHAAFSLVGYGMGSEASATLGWLASLPMDDKAMVAAVSSLTRSWTRDDAMAASAAIRELPPGAARDGAIVGLVWGSASIDPASALEWLDELGDPTLTGDLRQRAERTLARTARLEDLE